MKKIFFIAISVILFGCSNTTEKNTATQDPEIFVDLGITHAKHFSMRTTSEFVTLELLNPEDGEIEKIIKIEPNEDLKIISLTSTLNGMLSILGKTDQLVGISNAEYVDDKNILHLIDEGNISEFGDETSQSVEKIVASGANIVFYSGFGEEFPNQKQLEKIGITIVPVYDWREEDPLGKAEWIKLIGAITKTKSEAQNFFHHVESEYNRLSALVENTTEQPTVLSGNMLGDIWYTPVGDSYVAQLIKDAGGNYIYNESKGTGSLALSIEQILKDNDSTDIWINPGVDSKAKVSKINPHADNLACFNNMYCYSPNMNLFWERSAAEPHKVLSDLIHIFHPEIKEISSFYYYEKIGE